MILVKFRDDRIQLTKSISGGSETSKSTGVLALRAIFKISASPRAPLTRGDYMIGGGGS